MLKAGWGKYDHARKLTRVQEANPFSTLTTTYRWRDANGNGLFDPGETNPDQNGPDFLSQSGTANAVPDQKQPLPHSYQSFVGLEHELMPNFAVRVTGIAARFTNVPRRLELLRPYGAYSIPITNLDPGPDGRLGTADDTGQSFTYWDTRRRTPGAGSKRT